MLEDMKLLLGITGDDKDELLELLIKQAQTTAKAYTGLDSLNAALKVTIVKMAIFDYNRLGTEGLNAESYSGVSFTYATDYPDSILRELDAAKRASGIGRFKLLW